MTKRELIEKLSHEEGAVEEAEQWLAQLQAIDPYFWQSDRMCQFAIRVRIRRRAQEIRSQMDTPPSPEQIAALLDSIDYSKAQRGEDIEEMDARQEVLDQLFPH